jgi:hypothetical protein
MKALKRVRSIRYAVLIIVGATASLIAPIEN